MNQEQVLLKSVVNSPWRRAAGAQEQPDTSHPVSCPRPDCGRRFLDDGHLQRHLDRHNDPPRRPLGNHTAAQGVYEALKTRLTSGGLRPGALLNQAGLACSHGCGTKVVSEVIAQLAAEGLVVLRGEGTKRRAFAAGSPPDGDAA